MCLPPHLTVFNPIERICLTMGVCWFNNNIYKNEEKLLELFTQGILDVIGHPEKTRKTTAIGTLL